MSHTDPLAPHWLPILIPMFSPRSHNIVKRGPCPNWTQSPQGVSILVPCAFIYDGQLFGPQQPLSSSVASCII